MLENESDALEYSMLSQNNEATLNQLGESSMMSKLLAGSGEQIGKLGMGMVLYLRSFKFILWLCFWLIVVSSFNLYFSFNTEQYDLKLMIFWSSAEFGSSAFGLVASFILTAIIVRIFQIWYTKSMSNQIFELKSKHMTEDLYSVMICNLSETQTHDHLKEKIEASGMSLALRVVQIYIANLSKNYQSGEEVENKDGLTLPSSSAIVSFETPTMALAFYEKERTSSLKYLINCLGYNKIIDRKINGNVLIAPNPKDLIQDYLEFTSKDRWVHSLISSAWYYLVLLVIGVLTFGITIFIVTLSTNQQG